MNLIYRLRIGLCAWVARLFQKPEPFVRPPGGWVEIWVQDPDAPKEIDVEWVSVSVSVRPTAPGDPK